MKKTLLMTAALFAFAMPALTATEAPPYFDFQEFTEADTPSFSEGFQVAVEYKLEKPADFSTFAEVDTIALESDQPAPLAPKADVVVNKARQEREALNEVPKSAILSHIPEPKIIVLASAGFLAVVSRRTR